MARQIFETVGAQNSQGCKTRLFLEVPIETIRTLNLADTFGPMDGFVSDTKVYLSATDPITGSYYENDMTPAEVFMSVARARKTDFDIVEGKFVVGKKAACEIEFGRYSSAYVKFGDQLDIGDKVALGDNPEYDETKLFTVKNFGLLAGEAAVLLESAFSAVSSPLKKLPLFVTPESFRRLDPNYNPALAAAAVQAIKAAPPAPSAPRI